MEELGNKKNNEEISEVQQNEEMTDNSAASDVQNTDEKTDSNTEAEAQQTEEAADNDVNSESSDETSEEKKEEKKSSVLNDILEIFESVVISVFVVLLMFTYVARPVTVEGKSMWPTLNNKDKLIMRMLFYTPKVGDIVIVDNENSYTYDESTGDIVKGNGMNKRLIKRIIATGGQTLDIDFQNGTVTVDGKVLKEDYIADITRSGEGTFDYPVTVPEGYVFVMGDNRNNSSDSRSSNVGFVKESDILGEAVLRFYPFGDFKLLD